MFHDSEICKSLQIYVKFIGTTYLVAGGVVGIAPDALRMAAIGGQPGAVQVPEDLFVA